MTVEPLLLAEVENITVTVAEPPAARVLNLSGKGDPEAWPSAAVANVTPAAFALPMLVTLRVA